LGVGTLCWLNLFAWLRAFIGMCRLLWVGLQIKKKIFAGLPGEVDVCQRRLVAGLIGSAVGSAATQLCDILRIANRRHH